MPVRVDHIGITVQDLDAVTAFFQTLGFVLEARSVMEGEFLDTVVGMSDARTDVVWLTPPGGGSALEVATFIRPPTEPGTPDAGENVVGIRNLGFQVDDLDGLLERIAKDGYRPLGGVGEYEGIWRMAHVRGPEGIIVSLSERIGEPGDRGG